MKKILFLFSIIIVLGITVFSLVGKEKNEINYIPKVNKAFCGTKNLSEAISQGKALFKIHCAHCHKINKIQCPPILRSNFKNYSLDTFQKFLKNQERNRINDFPDTECMVFPKFEDIDIENIYNYLEYEIN